MQIEIYSPYAFKTTCFSENGRSFYLRASCCEYVDGKGRQLRLVNGGFSWSVPGTTLSHRKISESRDGCVAKYFKKPNIKYNPQNGEHSAPVLSSEWGDERIRAFYKNKSIPFESINLCGLRSKIPGFSPTMSKAKGYAPSRRSTACPIAVLLRNFDELQQAQLKPLKPNPGRSGKTRTSSQKCCLSSHILTRPDPHVILQKTGLVILSRGDGYRIPRI